jgi:hypothetical protein
MGRTGRPSLPLSQAENVQRGILELLKRNGDNKAAVGRLLDGMSGQSVGLLAAGGNRASYETAQLVAKALGVVDVQQLLSGESFAQADRFRTRALIVDAARKDGGYADDDIEKLKEIEVKHGHPDMAFWLHELDAIRSRRLMRANQLLGNVPQASTRGRKK